MITEPTLHGDRRTEPGGESHPTEIESRIIDFTSSFQHLCVEGESPNLPEEDGKPKAPTNCPTDPKRDDSINCFFAESTAQLEV